MRNKTEGSKTALLQLYSVADNVATPVIAGLAVGIGFVVMFAIFAPFIPWPSQPLLSSDDPGKDKNISIAFAKSGKPWAEGDYINLSKADLARDSVMLNGIRNAKIMYDGCFNSLFRTACQGSPFISYTAEAKVSEEEARVLVSESEFGFRDLSPPGNPSLRNYGLHMYYEGAYYGVAIIDLPQ